MVRTDAALTCRFLVWARHTQAVTSPVTVTGQTWSTGRLHLRRLPPVGEGQPIRQLSCSFIGGLPVERHHRRWDAGTAQELCAPAIADGGYLDQVRASPDVFFESMCGHCWMCLVR